MKKTQRLAKGRVIEFEWIHENKTRKRKENKNNERNKQRKKKRNCSEHTQKNRKRTRNWVWINIWKGNTEKKEK